MEEQTFQGLSNEELADVWYALTVAEARHTGGFKQLLDAAFAELGRRLGVTSLAAFLDDRYTEYRALDSSGPADQGTGAPPDVAQVRDTYPA
jgi:hypothetical protein